MFSVNKTEELQVKILLEYIIVDIKSSCLYFNINDLQNC